MAFGGNTRDLGSFGEETDKITDLHGIAWKYYSQNVETASGFICDAVWMLMTASEESETASRSYGRFNPNSLMTARRRLRFCDAVWPS